MGKPSLVKDGKSYPANADGLSQSVAGNPSAEAHARDYNRGMNVAIAEYLGGLGAMFAGFILGADRGEMGMSQPASSGEAAGGVVLVIGGVALMIVSAFQSTYAQAHFQDALNVYNDGVVPRPPPSPTWAPQPPAPPAQPDSPAVTPLPSAQPQPVPVQPVPVQPVPVPSESPAR